MGQIGLLYLPKKKKNWQNIGMNDFFSVLWRQTSFSLTLTLLTNNLHIVKSSSSGVDVNGLLVKLSVS